MVGKPDIPVYVVQDIYRGRRKTQSNYITPMINVVYRPPFTDPTHAQTGLYKLICASKLDRQNWTCMTGLRIRFPVPKGPCGYINYENAFVFNLHFKNFIYTMMTALNQTAN